MFVRQMKLHLLTA